MKSKIESFYLLSVFAGLIVLTGCKKETDTVELPLLSLPTIQEVTVQGALMEGIVVAQGGAEVTARGFSWSTSQDPAATDNTLTVGKGPGPFTGRLSGLLAGTDYYVRTWATSSEGTSYSYARMVTTPLTVTPAALVTLVPDYITSTSVFTGGEITSIGGGEITERGVCWNTDPSPTIENSRANSVITGAALGSFTIKLTSLDPGKTYYLRAYAVNSAGVSYGTETVFRTLALLGNIRAYFPGETTYHSVLFSIANKLYMGLGGTGDWDWVPAGDFWEWDQGTNQWTELTKFPGNQDNATGLAIGGKGYVLTNGLPDSEGNYAIEFWEYDPALNTWNRKSDFPSTASRINPAKFSIGNKGYIALNNKEFWEWDQATDDWIRKAHFPVTGRSGAATFVIGHRGYVAGGFPITENGTIATDLWEYDQVSDIWTRKADFKGEPNASAIGFAIGNRGYVAGRYADNANYEKTDFWEWDQVTDRWIKMGNADLATNVFAGGSIGDSGFFLAYSWENDWQIELWTFPMISEK